MVFRCQHEIDTVAHRDLTGFQVGVEWSSIDPIFALLSRFKGHPDWGKIIVRKFCLKPIDKWEEMG